MDWIYPTVSTLCTNVPRYSVLLNLCLSDPGLDPASVNQPPGPLLKDLYKSIYIKEAVCFIGFLSGFAFFHIVYTKWGCYIVVVSQYVRFSNGNSRGK